MFVGTRKELVEKALASLSAGEEKRKPDRTSALFSFRLTSGERAVPFTSFRCLSAGAKEPLPAVASRASNEKGEAIVFWRHRLGAPPGSLVLEVRKSAAEDWTPLDEVDLHPMLRIEKNLPGGLRLEISSEPFTSAPPAREEKAPQRKIRRFAVALVGSHQHLEIVLAPLRGHTCMKVHKIFVADASEAQAKSAYRGVQVASVAELDAKALEGIDALVDLSDHKAIAELHKARTVGQGDRLPLLFVGGRRFFLGNDRLAAWFTTWLSAILDKERAHAVE